MTNPSGLLGVWHYFVQLTRCVQVCVLFNMLVLLVPFLHFLSVSSFDIGLMLLNE